MLSPICTAAFPTITSTPLGSAASEGINSFKRTFAPDGHCRVSATNRCQSVSTRQRDDVFASRERLLRLHILVPEQGEQPAKHDTHSAEEG
jgi:hypothetical protein